MRADLLTPIRLKILSKHYKFVLLFVQIDRRVKQYKQIKDDVEELFEIADDLCEKGKPREEIELIMDRIDCIVKQSHLFDEEKMR